MINTNNLVVNAAKFLAMILAVAFIGRFALLIVIG